MSYDIAALDSQDPLRDRKRLFELPKGVIYLDGNSLGPLTISARRRASEVVGAEWGGSLIAGWNSHEWMQLPARVGDKIGRLIGAPPGSAIACDTTSVNIFKLLSVALSLRPGRKVILTDSNIFPTDLYMADGLVALKGEGYEVRARPLGELHQSLGADIAAVLLCDVDYRTGRRYDMAEWTARIHAAGALAVWDLCHSAGAMPVDVGAANADLAVGCSYKFLNGGPGAPAYVYVAPHHIAAARQPLTGWLGHAAPFDFVTDYRPAPGIERMLAGTPPVLALSVLDAALSAFDGVDMAALREKSLIMADVFDGIVAARRPDLERLTPHEPGERGSQISYRFAQGYPVMQALIAKGVVGDFRAPDIMRFGLTPLYLSYAEVARAAEVLCETVAEEPWRLPRFTARKHVT